MRGVTAERQGRHEAGRARSVEPNTAVRRLLKIVGHSARERADRLHLLCLAELFLQGLALGHIEDGSDHADGTPGDIAFHRAVLFHHALGAVRRHHPMLEGIGDARNVP